jgi:hypothetical protein
MPFRRFSRHDLSRIRVAGRTPNGVDVGSNTWVAIGTIGGNALPASNRQSRAGNDVCLIGAGAVTPGRQGLATVKDL